MWRDRAQSCVPAACSWPLCWKHLWHQFELFPQTDLVCLAGKNLNLLRCFSWVRANWGFGRWKGEGWRVWVGVIQEKKTNWAEDAADLGCNEHFWSNLSSHTHTVGKHSILHASQLGTEKYLYEQNYIQSKFRACLKLISLAESLRLSRIALFIKQRSLLTLNCILRDSNEVVFLIISRLLK